MPANEKSKYRIGIVGGGFTGLSAGLELLSSGHEVHLFEKAPELGGLAASFDAGAYKLERFYHQWYAGDEGFRWLLDLIGCSHKESTVSMKHGFYFRDAIWRTRNPIDHFRFSGLSLADSLRMAVALWRLRRVDDWREIDRYTVRQWFLKHGNERIYETFWKQLLLARFGHHADEISLVWVWQKLKRDQRYKSKKPKGQVASYYEGGFSALFDDVESNFVGRGGNIRCRTEINAVDRNPSGKVELCSASLSENAEFDRIILTVPLTTARALVSSAASKELLEKLESIEFLDSRGIVIRLRHSLSDLYWLANRDLAFPFVGVIEHTQFRPPADYDGEHIVYLSQSVAEGMPEYTMTDDEYIEFGLDHIGRMFGDFDRGSVIQAHTWRAADSQPLLRAGYHRHIPEQLLCPPDCFLATQAQIYPDYRGTHTAIREGRAIAREVLKSLAS